MFLRLFNVLYSEGVVILELSIIVVGLLHCAMYGKPFATALGGVMIDYWMGALLVGDLRTQW